jgi:hypothetical protein
MWDHDQRRSTEEVRGVYRREYAISGRLLGVHIRGCGRDTDELTETVDNNEEAGVAASGVLVKR